MSDIEFFEKVLAKINASEPVSKEDISKARILIYSIPKDVYTRAGYDGIEWRHMGGLLNKALSDAEERERRNRR